MKRLPLLVVLLSHAGEIPRTWDMNAIRSLQLSQVGRLASPAPISADEYYRIPERVIYRSYPVYAPGREPADYGEWLRNRDPEIAFDAGKLDTPESWIAAGEIVFNWPTSLNPVFFTAQDIHDPRFIRSTGMPVARDGTIPFARWVVRRKGVVELGSMGCATCHTRVLRDGTVVPGAQGNNPNDRQGALLLEKTAATAGAEAVLQRVRSFALQFEVSWRADDINTATRTMSLGQLIQAGLSIPPGVNARTNTSLVLPPQIPDLIGVKDRRFLDHTGIVRHRMIGDLMR